MVSITHGQARHRRYQVRRPTRRAGSLVAQILVDRVLRRFPTAIDSGHIESILELFHPHARFVIDDVPGADATGTDEITDLLARSGSRRSALGPVRLRHHVSAADIRFEADRAVAKSHFVAVSASGSDHWGVYRDVLTCVRGKWRSRERRVRVEGAVASRWWTTSELLPPAPSGPQPAL